MNKGNLSEVFKARKTLTNKKMFFLFNHDTKPAIII